MHVRYDSVACAAELIPKRFVINNVVAGWRPAVRGALPAAAPLPWMGLNRESIAVSPPLVGVYPDVAVPQSFLDQRAAKKQATVVLADLDGSLRGKAVCCYHELRHVVHLSSDLNSSRCGNVALRRNGEAARGMVVSWESATKLADDDGFTLCRSCFGRCMARVQGSVLGEDSVPLKTCASSSSSGSSADQESDSESVCGA